MSDLTPEMERFTDLGDAARASSPTPKDWSWTERDVPTSDNDTAWPPSDSEDAPKSQSPPPPMSVSPASSPADASDISIGAEPSGERMPEQMQAGVRAAEEAVSHLERIVAVGEAMSVKLDEMMTKLEGLNTYQ